MTENKPKSGMERDAQRNRELPYYNNNVTLSSRYYIGNTVLARFQETVLNLKVILLFL